MGWTSYHATHYKNGKVDRKAECDQLFGNQYKIHKSIMIGTVYYAAIEMIKKYIKVDETDDYTYVDVPEDEREIFAVVVLTQTDIKNYYNFYYKVISETSGPCERKCPDSILNLLSPTESEWANEWRRECREYNTKKKEKSWIKELPIGGKVRWSNGKREYVLTKHEPAYQYKTWFWLCEETFQHVKRTWVTEDNAVLVEE